MAYNYNIPQPTDKLSISQGDLLNNFTALNTWMGINHYIPTDLLNGGKHKFVQLPEQGSAPGTLPNEAAIYSKQGTGAVTQLFWQRENNGVEIEFTGVTVGTVGISNGGGTVLPSNVKLSWATVTIAAGASSAPGYFVGSYSNTDYALLISPINLAAGQTITISSKQVSSFNFSTTGTGTIIFTYLAIGV